MQVDARVRDPVEQLLAHAGDRLELDGASIIEAAVQHLSALTVKQHPLGFLHVDLTPLADRPRISVRLHVWTERSLRWSDSLGKQHDHVWSLKSVVLVGALTDIELRAAADPTGDFELAEISYGKTEDRAHPLTGRYSIEEIRRRYIPANGVYTLHERHVHTTAVESLPTATLVLAMPAATGAPVVLTPLKLGERGHSTARVVVAPPDAIAELNRALEAIRRHADHG